ncbi:hypothetical protein FOMPIDRAFT_1055896 [Fomitopsis schrenkii]|uniref:AAA+ ATPase domain-containing protein n=1 Tax=Fomitopsis schrenkii TaxID=2126942 RepID=S8DIV0_FOMSC|nr:hypothetical protein FOMPIDRAFT_1055896 [Fomitopsis schrenkii]
MSLTNHRLTSTAWPSDVPYELQPHGQTVLFFVLSPDTGGDTGFTSQVAALECLSPQSIVFLHSLALTCDSNCYLQTATFLCRSTPLPRRSSHRYLQRHTICGLVPRDANRNRVLHRPFPACSVLLWGPPGCGKTVLAKAVANESRANFINVKGPGLLNKHVGESERAVRQVFSRARASAPCVIFFDELDALVSRRDDLLSESSARVVNTLLTELDGLDARRAVYVIAATMPQYDPVSGDLERKGVPLTYESAMALFDEALANPNWPQDDSAPPLKVLPETATTASQVENQVVTGSRCGEKRREALDHPNPLSLPAHKRTHVYRPPAGELNECSRI